jgi:hypothetical protein
MTGKNRYVGIMERIFHQKHRTGDKSVFFVREDIEKAAAKLRIVLPKNLGDLIYSFRYRTELPASIRAVAPKGKEWMIRPAGRSRYEFVLVTQAQVKPNPILAETKIPDSTPGLISRYALSDEQALLARVRYNRLIDVFTGVACYSLQNHLRTTVAGGQVETDEIYIGVDRRGVHYVFPVQAKRGKDRLSLVQIEQDFAVCTESFPSLVGRPIAAQFMDDNLIALFEFEQARDGVRVLAEKHYRLVPEDELTDEEIEAYRKISD